MPSNGKTKQELENEIAALRAQLEEQSTELAARTAALSASGEDGWLITTPNPEYTGKTMNVDFLNGRAFVGASHPNAEFVVKQLEGDFGYRATPMNAKEFKALPAPAEPKPNLARQQLEELSTPRMVG